MLPTTVQRAPAHPDDDPSSLLPRRRVGTGLVVWVLAPTLLLAAWFSPQVLRPSLWEGSGGGLSTTFSSDGPQVLTTTVMEVGTVLPFTVEEVEDVAGAEVVGAWLVTGPDARSAEEGLAGAPRSAEAYLEAVLPSPDEARLPRRVVEDGRTALLVLWAVEDCAVLQREVEPVVRLRNALGVTVTGTLPWFTAPSAELMEPSPPAAGSPICAGG